MRTRTPSPALIVAVLALVVALGGTSYAALGVGRNSVGSKQLKANAVRSSKVKDRTLLARDFKPGQLPAGPQGVPGPQGAPGERGEAGPAGPTQGEASGFLDPPAQASTLASVHKITVTTGTAGSLYVTGNLDTSLDGCAAGADCRMRFGLYVDGKPVPGTKVEIGFAAGSGHGFQDVSAVGVAKGVEPGTHTVELRWIDISGNIVGGLGSNFANVGAVLLGG